MNVEANTATPANTPAPATQADMQAVQGSAGEAERFRDSVQFGLDRGLIGRARADKEMQDAGNTLPLRDVAPDTAAGTMAPPPGFEPGAVQDFTLPNVAELHDLTSGTDGKSGPALSLKDTIEIQNTVGGWMAEGQLPASIGSYIAKEAGRHIQAMPRYEQMQDGAKEAHRIGEEAKLRSLWGDKTAENIALAQKVVAGIEAKRPGLAAFLERTGLGNCSAVVVQLAQHGRRMATKV